MYTVYKIKKYFVDIGFSFKVSVSKKYRYRIEAQITIIAHHYIYIYIYVYMYICIYVYIIYVMPQKLTTTACFIQEESSGGRQFRKHVSCLYAQGGNVGVLSLK